MTLEIPLDLLLDYTDWQRGSWRAWFTQDPASLQGSTGPHTDGRFPTVGALVRHIFSAELRYVERLRGLPLTESAELPTTDPEALFGFAERGRRQLRELSVSLTPAEWDTGIDMMLLNTRLRLTPRKVLLHVVTHEIRHWAQVSTLLRQQGWQVPAQDLLFAPICGDPLRL